MKRKTKAWLAAGLSLLTVLGCTWAYYTNEAHMNNQLQTKTYGSTITEEFTPRDDWQPGQKVDKIFAVKNTGEYPQVVRVKMEETWARNSRAFKTIDSTTDKSDITTVYQENPTDGEVNNDKTVVSKDLNSADWTFNSADGYWYYHTQLTAGKETQALLRAITLYKDADMGKYVVTSYYHEGTAAPTFEPGETGDNGTKTNGWEFFDGAVPVPAPGDSNNKIFTRTISKLDPTAMGYAGADYTLTITAETCQATLAAVKEEWKLTTMPANTTWGLK